PLGALLGDAPNLLPTGSLQAIPTAPGSYGFAVMNWGSSPMPYTLRVITTNSTTGHLAGTAPSIAAGSRKVVVPDPVDGVAVMRYAMAQGGHVVVRIYDVAGRLVHRFEEDQPAGSYGISWDGRRTDGRRVPSGIYFYRVTLPGGKEAVQRTAILR
ncbi:MAG TPA: FlgD immunoglobulin-like domain containing protein, partial [Candidatus Eisenbacteria bacterium]|nr:FlgD immunoglobulin-like domain containing protein [Candidatus Eisenbacteria bacterium]